MDVSALRGDRSQLHDERVDIPFLLLLVEVIQRSVTTPASIEIPPAPADMTVGEIQPEVARVSRFFALPILRIRADLPIRRELQQVVRELRYRPEIVNHECI